MSQVHNFDLTNLSSLKDVDEFVRAAGTWSDGDVVVVDARRLRTTYPNACTYFAAAVDNLRITRDIRVQVVNLHKNQKRVRIFDPVTRATHNSGEYPTDEVWKYSSESEANYVTRQFMRSIEELIPCEEGVLDTLNWCIYEVLDNVFQHSRSDCGFAMMQLHVRNRTCVISVADSGRGIHRAMYDGVESGLIDAARVCFAERAIEYAMEQGITSKGRENQGNGLHGLRRAIEVNGGLLEITSGKGSLLLEGGKQDLNHNGYRPLLNSDTAHSTVVDWRLDCSRAVVIDRAMGGPVTSGSYIESRVEMDGTYVIPAEEVEVHIGSRNEGRELRIRIENILGAGAEYVIVDLTGVGVISSSFADEVFGKLAEAYGINVFQSRIFYKGARDLNISLINKAISNRLE